MELLKANTLLLCFGAFPENRVKSLSWPLQDTQHGLEMVMEAVRGGGGTSAFGPSLRVFGAVSGFGQSVISGMSDLHVVEGFG